MADVIFSVVMATYGRGRHILPSIRSVLAQDFDGYELLVVGDGCTDDTAEAVASLGSPKIRWDNLESRWGSQSGPNNLGAELARGAFIAYLGHDDVWASDHLSRLLRVFEGTGADYAVSGALLHMPPGVNEPRVTGVFAASDDEAPRTNFFPPSSIAHRRDVIDRIGGWARPEQIPAPVDVDLQQRALEAGMTFRSTEAVTVHKFTAAQRYLSYLLCESHEQEEMLARLSSPGMQAFVDERVDRAKAVGAYMTLESGNWTRREPGAMWRATSAKRGLMQPPPVSLGDGAFVEQQPGQFARDWQDEPDPRGVRWANLNPNPRWLVNVVADEEAFVCFALLHRTREGLLAFDVAGPDAEIVALGAPRSAEKLWVAPLCLKVRLSPDKPSILTFRLRPEQTGSVASPGVGLSEMSIVPAAQGEANGATLAQRHADRIAQALADEKRAEERSPYWRNTLDEITKDRFRDRSILGVATRALRTFGNVELAGWTIDRNDHRAPLEVLAFIDGVYVASVVQNRSAPKVARKRGLPASATPGFLFRLENPVSGARLDLLALGPDGRYAQIAFRRIEPIVP